MTKLSRYLAIPYWLWLLVFVISPIVLLIFFSFRDPSGHFTLDNYVRFFTSTNYLLMTWNSFFYALVITILTLVLAYPFAYFLTGTRNKDLWMLLVILPTWVNLLLKAYAFIGLLNKDSWIAQSLASLGLFEEGLLFTDAAFIIVASYIELPFMVLPIFRSLEAIPQDYLIASSDLGASKAQTFRRVIWPLSLDGVKVGVQTVFIPSLSLFLITRLIGGNRVITLGTAVEQHYLVTQDWGMGSTIGVVLILLMVVIIGLTEARERGQA